MKRAAIACLLLAACTRTSAEPRARSMIVLAFDGLDPALLRRMIDDGRAPSFGALAERGGFLALETSNPPQSPVAWSSFITGHTSDEHGIYDFLHRDPATMRPYLSTSRTVEPAVVELGPLAVPLGSGDVELLRKGAPFWSALDEARIPATVVRIPASYPPEPTEGGEVLSGMGTPDLLGTPGLFQVFTTDPALLAKPPSGGKAFPLDFRGKDSATAELQGPPDPFSADGGALALRLEVIISDAQGAALIRLGDEERLLRQGEWSDWIPVAFETAPLLPPATGIVRAYLRSLGANVVLYFSPVNIDPLEPAQRISSPETYSRELAEDAGRYYTQGMPEDTKALISGVLAREDFLTQAELTFAESRRLLERELARHRARGGLLFFYFSTTDLVSHMFWRDMEDGGSHPHVVPELYAKVDGLVGEVIQELDPATEIIILSDHGFAPFRYKVNLNTWLEEQGYLVQLEGSSEPNTMLKRVDWSKTRAYALGLNQLYLNLQGREPQGVVREAERERLLEVIARRLEGLRNPESGERVVTRAHRPKAADHADRTPDLIVGFNRGYRSSDESALGELAARVVEPNDSAWNGDHCMDPEHVPGVLITGSPLIGEQAALTDLAPTILAWFGVAAPGLEGRVLLERKR